MSRITAPMRSEKVRKLTSLSFSRVEASRRSPALPDWDYRSA
jgi:hypothetical protein